MLKWEYHLINPKADDFPSTQGFVKDSNNQWIRNGVPWGVTREVIDSEVQYEIGRDYKFFRTKFLKRKVVVYRRRRSGSVKAYIMIPRSDK